MLQLDLAIQNLTGSTNFNGRSFGDGTEGIYLSYQVLNMY